MTAPRINYDIRIVEESDFQEILDHYRKHFFKDGPLTNYLRIVTDENPVCEDLEAEVWKCLENPSQNLIAVHDGKIIGVCSNEVEEKNETGTFHKVELKNEKMKVIDEFVQFFTSEMKLFEKYPDCQKVFEICHLSVDGAYRRYGVAKALVYKAMELAKQFGCGVIKVHCSSLYSAKLFENLGYDKIFELAYADYSVKGDYKIGEEFRENGRIVLRPKEPHNALRVYVKRIV